MNTDSVNDRTFSCLVFPSIYAKLLLMCVWWTCLCGTQIGFIQEWVKRLDRTFHAHQFIFSFFSDIFLFYSCGGLSWLSVNFLLHVKYALSYRIVSYRKRWHKPILHNARTLATVWRRDVGLRSF